ncbi:MAG: toll/interleukin-1 receptor domain-containing protein [Anaerolineae bacterium]|jgi:hypothetical protein|nr:toll/interleukin-1 receptor domain-containing protein [Anaerolineae bacterium]
MAFSIFISHATPDREIAENVKRVINNAFQGHIKLYLAVEDLLPGRTWKGEIKNNLTNCDAIISIMTPRSLNRPWIYIEWTAFWLAEKPIYIFLTDDIKRDELVSPMSDLQTVNIFEPTEVRMLFTSLARDSKYSDAIPYEFVQDFVNGGKNSKEDVLRKLFEQSYGKYKGNLDQLPTNNDEKAKIAEYFFDQNDFETFDQIVNEITDDSSKCHLARRILKKGDLLYTSSIVRRMNSSEYLKSVAKDLFSLGYKNHPLLREIVDSMTNHTELRALGKYIALNKGENSAILTYIINRFSNNVELYKLGLELIDNNFYDSSNIEALVKHLAQQSQLYLRKFVEAFIDRDQSHHPNFNLAVSLLRPIQLNPLVDYWIKNKLHSAHEYVNQPLNENVDLVQALKTRLNE